MPPREIVEDRSVTVSPQTVTLSIGLQRQIEFNPTGSPLTMVTPVEGFWFTTEGPGDGQDIETHVEGYRRNGRVLSRDVLNIAFDLFPMRIGQFITCIRVSEEKGVICGPEAFYLIAESVDEHVLPVFDVSPEGIEAFGHINAFAQKHGFGCWREMSRIVDNSAENEDDAREQRRIEEIWPEVEAGWQETIETLRLADHHYRARLLRELGEPEMADLLLSDYDEFERRVDDGRKTFGRQPALQVGEDDGVLRWVTGRSPR